MAKLLLKQHKTNPFLIWLMIFWMPFEYLLNKIKITSNIRTKINKLMFEDFNETDNWWAFGLSITIIFGLIMIATLLFGGFYMLAASA